MPMSTTTRTARIACARDQRVIDAKTRKRYARPEEAQAMADVIVKVTLGETSAFRNVYPQETEDMIRQLQQDAWRATS